MNKIHLSAEQRALAVEFCHAYNIRPTFREYNIYTRRMKQLPPKGKAPRSKDIPHTTRGFEPADVKLDPEFNALVDLPEGWAVTSCYDSGGNHGVENAGLAVLRSIWNAWRPGEPEPPRQVMLVLDTAEVS